MSGDWRFARRPFWVFSHLFVAAVIASFVGFGLWQLDRLDQRRATNDVIAARSGGAVDLGLALDSPAGDDPGAGLDYQAVEGEVRFVEADLARVVNRSLNGVAGEHVVAIAIVEFDTTEPGLSLAVNRGFVPLGVDGGLDPLPTAAVTVTGWLRATVEQGRFGAADGGSGDVLPRFDTERIGARVGSELPPLWLQLATIDGVAAGSGGLPEPIPLPPLDDGPHLGYAVQWFVFASLGAVFYGLLLVRRASGHRTTEVVDR